MEKIKYPFTRTRKGRLSDQLLAALLLTTWFGRSNAYFLTKTNKFCYRNDPEFVHYATPVDFYGFF